MSNFDKNYIFVSMEIIHLIKLYASSTYVTDLDEIPQTCRIASGLDAFYIVDRSRFLYILLYMSYNDFRCSCDPHLQSTNQIIRYHDR